MADAIKASGPYVAVLAALVTGLILGVQARISRGAQLRERKQELFASAYEVSIQYAETACAVRRRRADAAAEERVRLSEQLREIQARLTWHEAWVRFEAPEVGAAYDELVARTRTVAGRSMKDAWLSPPAADDTAMVIPTSVVDLRALADVRERYMAAVEAHLRPRGRARHLHSRAPRPRRAMPPLTAPASPVAGTAPGAPGGPAGGSP
ncbi:hypothetical protein [Streptomyces lancefieldiae]|uniref:Secreted protein n=1 Tax=Streptomyces lancefieldiae TaxID=3075520 RepID=A0ABU3AZB7_9ACTN|nr:hypothetical protein [Streptomyces sp. DSM 40712]MDT0615531.1 hypothetical protein [Streptomyces sp. DSM 40712]